MLTGRRHFSTVKFYAYADMFSSCKRPIGVVEFDAENCDCLFHYLTIPQNKPISYQYIKTTHRSCLCLYAGTYFHGRILSIWFYLINECLENIHFSKWLHQIKLIEAWRHWILVLFWKVKRKIARNEFTWCILEVMSLLFFRIAFSTNHDVLNKFLIRKLF